MSRHPHAYRLYLVGLAILAAVYAPTLLRIPSGGLTAYMDDVGEAQVALNVWGTLHMTGYPLFAIGGNVFVSLARFFGVDAAFAPTLHSTFWGLIALSVLYWLAFSLTRRAFPALIAMLALGLTRSIWIHNVIPEVYSLTLAFVVILLALALLPLRFGRRDLGPGARVLLLALIGGFGVAHHRMVAFAGIGLLSAALPPLFGQLKFRRTLRTLITAIPVALIGFLPYLYLPIRAQANADWVYGDPRDWAGLWHEFTGEEAAYLMQRPESLAVVTDNIGRTLGILSGEMTFPLAAAGFVGLLVALAARNRAVRRATLTALLIALGYLAFLAIFHRAVMPEAVTMPITAMLVLGLALGLGEGLDRLPRVGKFSLAGALIIWLVVAHVGFVHNLTYDRLGLENIAAVRNLPDRAATLMIPWGPRHTSMAFSIYVSGENAGLTLLDHNADLRAVQADTVYTLRDTLYRYPLDWWASNTDRRAMESAAPGLIAVSRLPRLLPRPDETLNNEVIAGQIMLGRAALCRDDAENTLRLALTWEAVAAPARDYSVFVHLRGEPDAPPLAQADSAAPVYGWYPTTKWSPGELVADDFSLPTVEGGSLVAFGLYEQTTSGAFVNYPAGVLQVSAAAPCRKQTP